jgi:MFS family permease
MRRNIYLLGFLSFFNDLTADMITPLLPLFLAGMGVGAGFLGLMEGLANSLSNVTMLFSGWYADRYGNLKKATVFGYSLCSFVRPFIAIPIPGITLTVRLIDRIGKGIRTAPRDDLITASAEKTAWGESFGIQRAMDHAGALIGPPIAAWLLSAYGLKLSTLFLIACLPSIVSVLVIPKKIRFKEPPPQPASSFVSWKRLPKPLRRYLVIIFLSALSTPSELFLILRMQNLGLAPYQIPLAWFVLTLFILMAAYFGGILSDRWSRRRTIALGWGLFVLVFIAFAFNTSLGWGWILIALYGLHAGLIEAAERTYPAMLASAETRATVLGWYYFAYGVGLLPASLIFGILWDLWSPSAAFLINAGASLLVTFALFLLPSDRRPSAFRK